MFLQRSQSAPSLGPNVLSWGFSILNQNMQLQILRGTCRSSGRGPPYCRREARHHDSPTAPGQEDSESHRLSNSLGAPQEVCVPGTPALRARRDLPRVLGAGVRLPQRLAAVGAPEQGSEPHSLIYLFSTSTGSASGGCTFTFTSAMTAYFRALGAETLGVGSQGTAGREAEDRERGNGAGSRRGPSFPRGSRPLLVASA